MAAHSLRTHSNPQIPMAGFRCVKPFHLSPTLKIHPYQIQSAWLGISTRFSQDPPRRTRIFISTRRPIRASVVFSLPTAKQERDVSIGKDPKWSSKAIKSFAMSELEARKLKYPTTGTEALIMGILIEGTSFVSKYLRKNGITLLVVREETVKLLGKGDLYFFSPEHPPLTEDAQKALDWAVDEFLKSGSDGEITTAHLLLGVWAQEESPGHKILAVLGFNADKAKELNSAISELGFSDN